MFLQSNAAFLSGISGWAGTFPLGLSFPAFSPPGTPHSFAFSDVIKNNIQGASVLTPKYGFACCCSFFCFPICSNRLSLTNAVRQQYQSFGVKGFFRGLTPTVLRSMIVSAVRFSFYEFSLEWYAQYEKSLPSVSASSNR
jgi:hypothetical protein